MSFSDKIFLPLLQLMVELVMFFYLLVSFVVTLMESEPKRVPKLAKTKKVKKFTLLTYHVFPNWRIPILLMLLKQDSFRIREVPAAQSFRLSCPI